MGMRKHTDEDRGRFADWLRERLPDDITAEEMAGWERNGIATTRALRLAFKSDKGPPFRFITTTPMGATEARPTSACLFNKMWKEEPHGFARWLLQDQPATPPCGLSVLDTRHESSYQEWAIALLQMPPYTSEAELERLLLERRHTLTLPQAEVLVKRADKWAAGDVLALGDPGNFFFTANSVGGISVVNIRCDAQRWEPYLKGFASEHQRRPGCRLIVANLNDAAIHSVASMRKD